MKSLVAASLVFLIKCIHLHILYLNCTFKWVAVIIACCFICACCELAGSSVEFEAEAPSCHENIDSDKYKCTECGERCPGSNELAIHRQSHSGEKPFECIVCSKRFTRAGNLVVHSRIHSGEKPYNCRMCDKAFSRPDDLNTHMRVHTGDKPYNCSPVSYTHLTLPTIYSV